MSKDKCPKLVERVKEFIYRIFEARGMLDELIVFIRTLNGSLQIIRAENPITVKDKEVFSLFLIQRIMKGDVLELAFCFEMWFAKVAIKEKLLSEELDWEMKKVAVAGGVSKMADKKEGLIICYEREGKSGVCISEILRNASGEFISLGEWEDILSSSEGKEVVGVKGRFVGLFEKARKFLEGNKRELELN